LDDYYLDIILGHKIEVQKGLYLLSSKLGWILTCRTGETDKDTTDVNMLILTPGNNMSKSEIFTDIDDSIPTKPDLQDFLNFESIGVTENLTVSDDQQAMQSFRDTLTFKNNRYFVTWPWRDGSPNLPDNRPLAAGRLKSLITRLHDKPDVLKIYDSVIQGQLAKRLIEKVDRFQKDGVLHYLPHHPVIKLNNANT
jgi:hypothetical protein